MTRVLLQSAMILTAGSDSDGGFSKSPYTNLSRSWTLMDGRAPLWKQVVPPVCGVPADKPSDQRARVPPRVGSNCT